MIHQKDFPKSQPGISTDEAVPKPKKISPLKSGDDTPETLKSLDFSAFLWYNIPMRKELSNLTTEELIEYAGQMQERYEELQAELKKHELAYESKCLTPGRIDKKYPRV